MTPMNAQGPATAAHAARAPRDDSPLPPKADLDVWAQWEKVFDAARVSAALSADTTASGPARQPVGGGARKLATGASAGAVSNAIESADQAPASSDDPPCSTPGAATARLAGDREQQATPAKVQGDSVEGAAEHPLPAKQAPRPAQPDAPASTAELQREAHTVALAPEAHAATATAPRLTLPLESDAPPAALAVDRQPASNLPSAPMPARPAAPPPAKHAPSETAANAPLSATPPERQDIARESVHVFQSARAVAVVVRDASLSPDVAIRCALETAQRLLGERRALQHVTLNGRTIYDPLAEADQRSAIRGPAQPLCFDG